MSEQTTQPRKVDEIAADLARLSELNPNAFMVIELVLALLLDCGIVSEAGGVDLDELSEAVAAELEMREAVA